jgi:PII-like signaling protein
MPSPLTVYPAPNTAASLPVIVEMVERKCAIEVHYFSLVRVAHAADAIQVLLISSDG